MKVTNSFYLLVTLVLFFSQSMATIIYIDPSSSTDCDNYDPETRSCGNGIELMQKAKKMYPGIKVIIFSGFNDEGLTNKCLGSGADYFFSKSAMDFNDLLQRISILTSR